MVNDTAEIIGIYCPVCGRVYDTLCIKKLIKRGDCDVCHEKYDKEEFKHVWSTYKNMYKSIRSLHDKWIKEGNTSI